MPDQTANPYVGPRSFEEEDSPNFFGRNEDNCQLASLVISHRVVLFYAPSGAGKTSMLQAGVIPKLKQRKKLQILPITRVGGELPPAVDGDHVENIYVFNTLANLGGKRAKTSALVGLSLKEGLQPHIEHQTDEQRLRPKLLILDQFEELFTTHTDRYRERDGFFMQLQECLTEYPQLSLLLSMREDYIANLDFYASQMPDRLRTRFRIELLTHKCALEAVKEPAERAKRPFAPGVAEELVDDLRRLQPGRGQDNRARAGTNLGNYVEPVHLQIVCQQLWEKLPADRAAIMVEDLYDFGDVDQALTKFYRGALEAVVKNTGIEERRLRNWFDKNLVTPNRTRGLVFRGEVETQGLSSAAVDILYQKYIIRTIARGNDIYYELAHDRLVEPVMVDNAAWRNQNLNRFQGQAALWEEAKRPNELLLSGKDLEETETWADAHFVELELHEKAFLDECRKARETTHNEALRKAEEACRKAEQRAKKLRTRLLFAITGIVIAVVAAFAARHYWKQAECQTRIAAARELASQSQATLASYPQRSLLLAIESVETTTRACESRVPIAEEVLRQALASVGGRIFKGHERAIYSIAISADNRWVVTGSEDNTARLWDLMASDPGAAPVVLSGHDKKILAVVVSPDSRWVVTVSDDNTARLWDLKASNAGAKRIELRGHDDKDHKILAVAISADSRWVVTGGEDKTARLYDLGRSDAGTAAFVLNGHHDKIVAVAISADNRWVVTGSGDKTARLWDLGLPDPGSAPIELSGHGDKIRAVAISADSRWVVTGSEDKTARLWDLGLPDPGAVPTVLRGHSDKISAVAISADSRWVVTGSEDKTARLWDLGLPDPGAAPIVLRGHEGGITAINISADGRWVVTASIDNTARLWDLRAPDLGTAPIVLRGHDDRILAVAISADSRWVVTGGWDIAARLWDLKAPDQATAPIIIRGNEEKITAGAISANGRWVVTGSEDNTARLWDLRAPDQAAVPIIIRGNKEKITALAISADGRWVVTGSEDKSARVWDLSLSGPAAASIVLREHEKKITAITISADGRWVVTGSEDQTARVWDLRASGLGVDAVVLRGHKAIINAVAISADSRWVVTGSDDQTARLWDLRLPDPAAMSILLQGHEYSIRAVAVSPDSRWVVTGSDDQTARLWDLWSPDPAAMPIVLRSHKGSISAVAFSADSRWVVTGSVDQTARLWEMSLDKQVELARRAAGRKLTEVECKQYIWDKKDQKVCLQLADEEQKLEKNK